MKKVNLSKLSREEYENTVRQSLRNDSDFHASFISDDEAYEADQRERAANMSDVDVDIDIDYDDSDSDDPMVLGYNDGQKRLPHLTYDKIQNGDLEELQVGVDCSHRHWFWVITSMEAYDIGYAGGLKDERIGVDD